MNAKYEYSGWSDGEIRAHYRDALDKAGAIKILCDLTLLAEEEIRVILGDAADVVPAKKKEPKKRFFYDYTDARKFYDAGLTDTQISEKTGIDLRSIWHWRKKEGLPKNERGGKKSGWHTETGFARHI